MSDTIQDAYADHVEALKALGASLRVAADIRYTPSPSMIPAGSGGIPNPTLDAVLDPLRSTVSDEMTRAAFVLWRTAEQVRDIRGKVDAAVAAWQGEPSSAP